MIGWARGLVATATEVAALRDQVVTLSQHLLHREMLCRHYRQRLQEWWRWGEQMKAEQARLEASLRTAQELLAVVQPRTEER